ncbi:YunG family protein [Paraburkholderia caribensis]
MKISSAHELERECLVLRAQLETKFASDTAYRGVSGSQASTGHCGAVSTIVHVQYGGSLVSTTVDGISHWFNRLDVDGQMLDVDLTGDQFGRRPVQVGIGGSLYPKTIVRRPDEIDTETRSRATTLAKRAGLTDTAQRVAVSA